MNANKSPSQSACILAELKRHPGQWVSMPDLVSVSGAYAIHSRVAELRKQGHPIENRVSQQAFAHERTKHSFYRLNE